MYKTVKLESSSKPPELNLLYIKNETKANLFIFPLVHTDVNECQISRPCDRFNGYCVNFPGKYECRCNPGFELDTNDAKSCHGKQQASDIFYLYL